MKLFLFSLLVLFTFIGFFFYQDTKYRKKKLSDVLGEEIKEELNEEMSQLQNRKQKFEQALEQAKKGKHKS